MITEETNFYTSNGIVIAKWEHPMIRLLINNFCKLNHKVAIHRITQTSIWIIQHSIWIRSNWWCPAGVKSILINKVVVVVYLRLISYMPDKLVAVLFYWSLNAKSSKFLLSSPVCDFQPKHGLKQLFHNTNTMKQLLYYFVAFIH